MLTRNRQTRARTNTKNIHQHQHVGISVNTDTPHHKQKGVPEQSPGTPVYAFSANDWLHRFGLTSSITWAAHAVSSADGAAA